MENKFIHRELKESTLNTYINGNLSCLSEAEKLLCAYVQGDLSVSIDHDICVECGETDEYCTCNEEGNEDE